METHTALVSVGIMNMNTGMGEKKKEVVCQIPGMLIIYNDGSIDRPGSFGPTLPPCPPNGSKDVTFHDQKGLWVRLFLPHPLPPATTAGGKLPIVLYFHGGGMCLGSPSDAPFHLFCAKMASLSGAIWISAYYRLAPEHRLPASFEDGADALAWLRRQASLGANSDPACEPWLAKLADFSRVFLAGESAGATVAHSVAIGANVSSLDPLRIAGLVAIHPGFFKETLPQAFPGMDEFLTEDGLRLFLALSLPHGETSGHPLLNPFHPDAPQLENIHLPPTLVFMATHDILKDAAKEYFEHLCGCGKEVELFVTEGEGHAFHLRPLPDNKHTHELEVRLVHFIEKYGLSNK